MHHPLDGEIVKIIEPVIWFQYKGDEVCWTGEGYTSISVGGTFQSLEEMDFFWERYWRDTCMVVMV